MKKIVSILIIIMLVLFAASAIKSYFFHPKVYALKSWFFTWAGDTKVMDESPHTISGDELKKLRALVQPGDIFLNRSDYYLSNIGIPGFWTHAGLYVGTPDERKGMFKDNSDCINWVKMKGHDKGNFEELLHHDFGKIYNTQSIDWKEMNIIESISEGVVISSFEAGVKKEGIVVLRPILAVREKMEAIYKAFGHVYKPYDFNFDFSTDTVIACTELVYKVYENSALFPVNDMFGKPFSTANEIVEFCDLNYGKPELKLSLIYIFDGKNGYTSENDSAHAIFRKSWNESLW